MNPRGSGLLLFGAVISSFVIGLNKATYDPICVSEMKGKSITFEAEIPNVPLKFVKWTLNGNVIVEWHKSSVSKSLRSPFVLNNETFSLTITALQPEDTGFYECTVNGYETAKSYQLIVQVPGGTDAPSCLTAAIHCHQDYPDEVVCSSPEECQWNSNTISFHKNKALKYECELFRENMYCLPKMSKEMLTTEAVCSSYSSCGFSRTFSDEVICEISFDNKHPPMPDGSFDKVDSTDIQAINSTGERGRIGLGIGIPAIIGVIVGIILWLNSGPGQRLRQVDSHAHGQTGKLDNRMDSVNISLTTVDNGGLME